MITTRIRHGLAGIATVAATLVAFEARALTVYLVDFDGTVVDDQSPRSTWRRMWNLKLSEEVRNLLQRNPLELGIPEIMSVSYREYRTYVKDLARGKAELNLLEPRLLEFDPLKPERNLEFVPGYYYVSEDVSFTEYRQAVGTNSHLVRNQEEAIKRAALDNAELERKIGRAPVGDEVFHWRGKAWPLVRKAMSRPETVANLNIFTAGNHLPWEWEKVFKIWKREKLIEHAHGRERGERTAPRVYAMSDPSALRFGRGSFAKRKGALLRALAEDLADNTRDRHFELSPDGRHVDQGVDREGHTLIVAEDDPQMLTEIRSKLMALSAEHHIGSAVKFVLLNTMNREEAATDRLWPHEWTVFHRRIARPATADEIARWTSVDDCTNALLN